MQADNPAVYECPKTRSGIHHWTRRDDGTAWCIKCDQELTVPQAVEVFTDYDRGTERCEFRRDNNGTH